MNNPIEEQRLIIDQLYRIVKESCPTKISSAKCRFEYDHDNEDGSVSIGSAFSFVANAEECFPALNREYCGSVSNLIEGLHAKMKSHTGGNWIAFTLFINEDGSVTTKFEYPNDK
ncbi:MAG: hypothetical protein HRU28_15800 [Rhizobiales bacterium]|nr:hypothetical protein [Hyphomicrobiales bacterium]